MNNNIGSAEQDEKIQNLSGTEAVKQIKDLIDKSGICFFCTNVPKGSMGSRPMGAQQVDEQGNIWFLSARESEKNKEIATDPSVMLHFMGSNADFLYIEGKASINYDKAKIKELWNPLAKTWFTEGEDDPRISIIKVEPVQGYYWTTQHGNVVSPLK